MTMTTAIILNHDLTPEQLTELRNPGGQIVVLPPELRPLWGQVPAEGSYGEVKQHLLPVLDWLYAIKADTVVCQGDFTAFAVLLRTCEEHSISLLVATSRRDSVEETLPDGSVVKKNVFRHVQFRRVA